MNFLFCIYSFLVGVQLSVSQKLSVTPDGCPFPYDLGKFDFKYKRPQICDTLLPDPIVGLPPQTSPKQFTLTMDPVPDSGSDYYDVIINIPDDFVDNTVIAGTAIRIQKVENGEAGGPAGHFDATPESGYSHWRPYCCGVGTSKFHTLVYTFIVEPSKRQYQLIVRWYPFNFKEGTVVVQANVFLNETAYWRLRTPQYKIPFTHAVTEAPPA